MLGWNQDKFDSVDNINTRYVTATDLCFSACTDHLLITFSALLFVFSDFCSTPSVTQRRHPSYYPSSRADDSCTFSESKHGCTHGVVRQPVLYRFSVNPAMSFFSEVDWEDIQRRGTPSMSTQLCEYALPHAN